MPNNEEKKSNNLVNSMQIFEKEMSSLTNLISVI